jgi:hypothetical protein
MKGPASNVAVTLFAASMVTTHSPVVFEQSPDQPAKVELPSVIASRITVAFAGKSAELVPSERGGLYGIKFTEPPPAPVMETVNG